MNEGRTRFADDATLAHISTLETRVQLLAKALLDIKAIRGGMWADDSDLWFALAIIDCVIIEAGLNKEGV